MTTYRAVIDFTQAEIAGLSEEQCGELAEHTFDFRTDCTDPAQLREEAFEWCESMELTIARLLEIDTKFAGIVVAQAFTWRSI